MQNPANQDQTRAEEIIELGMKAMKTGSGCYPVSSHMYLGRSISRRTGLKACLELDIFVETQKSDFELEEEIHALFQTSNSESNSDKKEKQVS